MYQICAGVPYTVIDHIGIRYKNENVKPDEITLIRPLF